MADPVDLAPTHLGGDPLRVPVCEEANSKDDRLDPSRDGGSHPMRASGIGNQTGDSICHEGGLPAVEGSRRAADLQTGVLDAVLVSESQRTHPSAHLSKARTSWLGSRSAVLRGDEEEARAFLVPVATNPPARVRWSSGKVLRHRRKLSPSLSYVCGNFN